jgi:hypothetical protein
VRNRTIQCVAGGRMGALTSVRADFSDFHLRMEIYMKNYGTSVLWHSANEGERNHFYSFATGNSQANGTIAPLGAYRVKLDGVPAKSVVQDGLHALTAPELAPLAKETWHVVEVIAVGNVFRMRVDGREVSAFSDARSRFHRGQIGIRTAKDSGLVIRKIEIRELGR